MLIDGFNLACKNIAANFLKVGDECMSAICFWETAKGNSSHLSYILCKPEPLGTEFKTVACSVQGHFYLLKYREGMKG